MNAYKSRYCRQLRRFTTNPAHRLGRVAIVALAAVALSGLAGCADDTTGGGGDTALVGDDGGDDVGVGVGVDAGDDGGRADADSGDDAPVCGNGRIDAPEVCDDANADDGDGCAADCSQIEDGYDCQVPGQACIAKSCGDGILAGREQCDDANADAGDGCSERCELEPGYACPTPGQACSQTTCGDGSVDGLEQCDDANTDAGDGCSGSCEVEIGYKCPTAGQPCAQTTCGDGAVEGAEMCDDANSDAGDGCDADCQIEPGFGCPTAGQACTETTCGDGRVEGLEACDDGNRAAGDGCDPLCREELIWDCSAGSCDPVCGDGVTLYPFEACDDGNLDSGDGCSAACAVEEGFDCTDFDDQSPPSVDVPVVYHDFQPSHPDFEEFSGSTANVGMVQNRLRPDGTPEYVHGASQVTSPTTFAQWYHDDPSVNQTIVQTLTLSQDTDLDPSGRTYRFSSSEFFPIDNQGWGNNVGDDGFDHNALFTSIFRSYFEYRGGETLDFTGDDDVWVFVNGRLAVDLGGLHTPVSGSVTLSGATDSQTGQIYDHRFDIYEGGVYEIAVFQAERHTTGSNYKLTLAGFLNTGTSVCTSPCGDGVVDVTEECDDGNTDIADGCDSQCNVEPGYQCATTSEGRSECSVRG